MQVQDHVQAIDDALDAFAEDSLISLRDYAETMEEIAYRMTIAAQAAQDEVDGR